MSTTINQRDALDIEISRVSADAVVFRNKQDGVYQAFAATLSLIAKDSTGQVLFTLAIGSGITLSTYNSVANAQATVLFTEAQTAMIPKNGLTTYILVEGTLGTRTLHAWGNLIGREAND